MTGSGVVSVTNLALKITTAYIFGDTCHNGNMAPTNIHAVHTPSFGTPEFYHFDGQQWTQTGTAANSQVLTGMDAIQGNYLMAVGRTPDSATGTNNEVSWIWDGNSWTQQHLPVGTAGLSDISFAK